MRLLSILGGRGWRSGTADELSVLRAPTAEVLLHPADLVISTPNLEAARIRAVLSTHLAFTRAYLTYSREANEMEERLDTMQLPYEEWEVLFRQVLLLDRAIEQRSATDGAGLGTDPAVDGAVRALGRTLLRTAARVVSEALREDGA